MSANIADLDLSGSEAKAARGGLLKPGRYLCRTSDAKVKPCSGGMQLNWTLTAVDGSGVIQDFIIYHHTSAEAVRIGKDKIKAGLTFGGHPNPNKPGNVNTYNDLLVGVTVVADDNTYVDKNGVTRTRGSQVQGYFDPKELGTTTIGAAAGAARRAPAVDDEIPF